MIQALGWCDMERWGWVGAHAVSAHGSTPDLSAAAEVEMLIGRPVRYYSRMPIQTRLSLIAMSQALQASRWVETGMREIGMTTAGYDGCLDADHRYFRDYVETGRVAGRGSLFIYTLATSSLGEAAIALRLSGPTLYVHSDVAPVATLVEQSRQMAVEGQSQGVLATWSDIRAAVCFAVGAEAGDGLDEMIKGHWESSPRMLARHLTARLDGSHEQHGNPPDISTVAEVAQPAGVSPSSARTRRFRGGAAG